MSLLDIRTLFVDKSGRADLVVDTTNYVDAGANFFINAGQRFLDARQLTPHAKAELSKTLTIGDSTWEFADCRSVEWVRIFDTDDGFFKLTKRTRDWIRQTFNEPVADITQDVPEWYAIDVIRVPITEGKELLRGIIFMPPADKAYRIDLEGLFWSKTLALDADISWWTENYDDLLVTAAMYKLEQFYRNTEGANDWLLGIDRDLRGIDFDMVSEDVGEPSTMVG